MKVLFAVNNEEISKSIVKNYQRVYKDIISYKNVYYFNALIKEIKNDKSYDRIVISEDLEPNVSKNYDNIDNLLFEKLDNISDDASDNTGNETPIILICTDRRNISDSMLGRIFGIGIYNALIGGDRSIENVCKLINQPRTKKEAKVYYKIDSEDVNYASSDENTVSEVEIQNIKAHFTRLEKSNKEPEIFVASFDNIVAQYNPTQLKLIIKFLPLGTKVVLEQNSSEYQKITMYDRTTSPVMQNSKNKTGVGKRDIKTSRDHTYKPNTGINILDRNNVPTMTKPVVIPGANTAGIRKIQTVRPVNVVNIEDFDEEEDIISEEIPEVDTVKAVQPVGIASKKGRGRPRKVVSEAPQVGSMIVEPKKGRGRPRKIVPEAKNEPEAISRDIQDITTSTVQPIIKDIPKQNFNNNLYGLANEDKYTEDYIDTVEYYEDISVYKQRELNAKLSDVNDKPSRIQIEREEEIRQANMKKVEKPVQSATVLPGFDEEDEEDEYVPEVQEHAQRVPFAGGVIQPVQEEEQFVAKNGQINYLLTGDKKIVTFVGATKNGCSFLINNLAVIFSEMGIKTAILDMTESKNSYYIYTKNKEEIRQIAYSSINKLEKGVDEGIKVNANLSVFTDLPGKRENQIDAGKILSTLAKNYSIVLIDSDFNTSLDYFSLSSEIYLVQSLDILTIQPFTAFLRELKTRDILKDNIRVVINKYIKCRGLSTKNIIGGLAFYNDPAMTFMHELFNRDTVKDYIIPFEQENYARYIENLVSCNITLNGYSKDLLKSLKELADGVYPLVGGKGSKSTQRNEQNKFSSNMSNTLEQMKNNY